MKQPSRKKFQEVLRCLKQVCKNDRLPALLRVRAAELICTVYGVPLPETGSRTKRAVKELVQERAFERDLKNQIEEKRKADAVAAAREFLEQRK